MTYSCCIQQLSIRAIATLEPSIAVLYLKLMSKTMAERAEADVQLTLVQVATDSLGERTRIATALF